MARRQPDHIAPPPGVLRRVLLCYAGVVALLVAGWCAWAGYGEYRYRLAIAAFEADSPIHRGEFPCCRETDDPIKQSTAYLLRQALLAAADPNHRGPDGRPSPPGSGWAPPAREKCAALLKRNAKAIDLLHQAATAKRCGAGVSLPPVYISHLAGLELVASAPLAAMEQNQPELALEIMHDAMTSYRRSLHDPNSALDKTIVASALRHPMGEFAFQCPISPRTRPIVHDLIAQLLDDAPRRRFDQTIRLFARTLYHPLPAPGFSGEYVVFLSGWPWWRNSEAQVVRDWLELKQISQSMSAREICIALTDRDYTHQNHFTVPNDQLAMATIYRDTALNRMAAITLAQRLYEADHGAAPADLADLAPGYLPEEALRDPFLEDGGLFTRPQLDCPWILHSVGQYWANPDDVMWTDITFGPRELREEATSEVPQ